MSIKFDIVNKTTCLCARRASGKSQLLRYIILKNKHLFDARFLICPTEKINKFYSKNFTIHTFFKHFDGLKIFSIQSKYLKNVWYNI